jgi:hypothetical protein
MSVDKRVNDLHKMWCQYQRGVLCGLDGRRAVVDKMILMEKSILADITEAEKKKWYVELNVIRAWRKSAEWMLNDGESFLDSFK